MMKKPVKIAMTPGHPGSFVREEILAPLGLSIAKAAKVLGVRRATLSDLLNEKTALSPEMALRLEMAFGVSMDLMLRIQTAWDVATTRQKHSGIKISRYQVKEDSAPPKEAR
ncbi:MAG: HigA family addiction module antidote protein [Rhodomicrobium sp.]|nr:HigA family addiction module antidote protein [Rhodomicrobium sp.]